MKDFLLIVFYSCVTVNKINRKTDVPQKQCILKGEKKETASFIAGCILQCPCTKV